MLGSERPGGPSAGTRDLQWGGTDGKSRRNSRKRLDAIPRAMRMPLKRPQPFRPLLPGACLGSTGVGCPPRRLAGSCEEPPECGWMGSGQRVRDPVLGVLCADCEGRPHRKRRHQARSPYPDTGTALDSALQCWGGDRGLSRGRGRRDGRTLLIRLTAHAPRMAKALRYSPGTPRGPVQ